MTTRIAVSLRWDDAIDLDRAMTQQVAADCIAHLQGPGPTLIDVLDSIDDTRIELVGWSSEDGPVPLSWLRRVAGQWVCLLYTSPSPRDLSTSRMPSSA